MKRKHRSLLLFSTVIIYLFSLYGCATIPTRKHWPDELPSATSSSIQSKLKNARRLHNSAADRKGLEKSMSIYQRVFQEDPGNRDALVALCNQSILLGTAYTEGKDVKRRRFEEAIFYCEMAMYTNPAFRDEVQSGKTVWDSARTLKKEDAPAMLFWVTAVQYQFKEVLNLPEKMLNFSWLHHSLVLLDRIKEVAPDYGNGAVELAYTVCYCALPPLLGGDGEKCRENMENSLEKNGKDYLLARWARGKYFHQVTGDKEASFRDLKWVAKQDLRQFKDSYPWRVHFKEDAQKEVKKEVKKAKNGPPLQKKKK